MEALPSRAPHRLQRSGASIRSLRRAIAPRLDAGPTCVDQDPRAACDSRDSWHSDRWLQRLGDCSQVAARVGGDQRAAPAGHAIGWRYWLPGSDAKLRPTDQQFGQRMLKLIQALQTKMRLGPGVRGRQGTVRTRWVRHFAGTDCSRKWWAPVLRERECSTQPSRSRASRAGQGGTPPSATGRGRIKDLGRTWRRTAGPVHPVTQGQHDESKEDKADGHRI